jgi:hypothetical protein
MVKNLLSYGDKHILLLHFCSKDFASDTELFQTTHASTAWGAYSPYCYNKYNRLISHIAILSGTPLWLSEPISNDNIAVVGREPATLWLRERRANHYVITAG